jgi:hypothetical protein
MNQTPEQLARDEIGSQLSAIPTISIGDRQPDRAISLFAQYEQIDNLKIF